MQRNLFVSTVLLTTFALIGCGSGGSSASSSSTPSYLTPVITFSSSSIPFTGVAGTTTAAQSVTLTNSGGAALTITGSPALGGTNSSDFALATASNACGTSLAPGTSCTISATFDGAAASTTYTATITLTDNASNSPQTISLSGTTAAPAGTTYHTLYVYGPDTPASITGYTDVSPLISLVNGAIKTIDMTMYELQDTNFTGYLTAACAKGVVVRVILSQSEESNNTPAYNTLNTAGVHCSAVYSNNAFTNTHQKTITIDSGTSTAATAILSLNLQTQYYTTTRDFELLENDPSDIAAIETTFSADYAAGTPYGGTQGASDFSYAPGAGNGDLIWSPTTAEADMLGIINGATTSLLIENEEMSAPSIVNALETACGKKVTVNIAMVDSSTKPPYSDYSTEFQALEAAGCGVHVYPDTTTGLYIHAKAVVADYDLPTQKVYMGSINYSDASMTKNRELGIYITDPTAVTTLNNVMAADYAGASPF